MQQKVSKEGMDWTKKIIWPHVWKTAERLNENDVPTRRSWKTGNYFHKQIKSVAKMCQVWDGVWGGVYKWKQSTAVHHSQWTGRDPITLRNISLRKITLTKILSLSQFSSWSSLFFGSYSSSPPHNDNQNIRFAQLWRRKNLNIDLMIISSILFYQPLSILSFSP